MRLDEKTRSHQVYILYIYLVGGSGFRHRIMEKEIKIILAILFDIQKDIRAIKNHLGVKTPKKEKIPIIEEEKKEKPKEDILKLYPKVEEVIEEKIPIKIKK
jgi:hypothetical protein